MRNKFPSFIALVCILIYAGAVLFGAYRVYTGIQNRRELAVKELDGVQTLVTQNGSRFYTEPFRDELRKRLAGSTALQGIIITGSQGSVDFERAAGDIIRRDPNPRFIPKFGYASLEPRPLDITGSGNTRLYAAYNAVDYAASVTILKQVLFAVLSALLLSFLTMMITTLTSHVPVQVEQPDDDTVNTPPPRDPDFLDDDFFDMDGEPKNNGGNDDIDTFTDDFPNDIPGDLTNDLADLTEPLDTEIPDVEDSGSEDFSFDLPDFDDLTGEDAVEPAAATEDNLQDDDFHIDDFLDEADLSLPELNNDSELNEDPELNDLPRLNDDPEFDDLPEFNDDPELSDLPELDDEPFETSVPDFSDADDFQTADTVSSGEGIPQGLYSPRSNVGWEAYTRDRLSSELHICASSEQDLVVLLVECGDGVNCDGELYKKIADTAVELFNLKELTFEYGERGITVIIPNAGLEQGISKAEAFHTRLFKNCPDSFHAKNDLLAGLSSRSGRLIEADRLMLEASRALEKAKVEAGSPIVAFKSDPEKYREYLQKESV